MHSISLAEVQRVAYIPMSKFLCRKASPGDGSVGTGDLGVIRGEAEPPCGEIAPSDTIYTDITWLMGFFRIFAVRLFSS